MRHEHDSLCREDSEGLPTEKGRFEFEYNKYICLECGKKLEVKDWENFERNHFVLKNQNDIQHFDIENIYHYTIVLCIQWMLKKHKI